MPWFPFCPGEKQENREFPGWLGWYRDTHSSLSPRKILHLPEYFIYLLTWSWTKWFTRQFLNSPSSGIGKVPSWILQSSSVSWSWKPHSSVQSGFFNSFLVLWWKVLPSASMVKRPAIHRATFIVVKVSFLILLTTNTVKWSGLDLLWSLTLTLYLC